MAMAAPFSFYLYFIGHEHIIFPDIDGHLYFAKTLKEKGIFNPHHFSFTWMMVFVEIGFFLGKPYYGLGFYYGLVYFFKIFATYRISGYLLDVGNQKHLKIYPLAFAILVNFCVNFDFLRMYTFFENSHLNVFHNISINISIPFAFLFLIEFNEWYIRKAGSFWRCLLLMTLCVSAKPSFFISFLPAFALFFWYTEKKVFPTNPGIWLLFVVLVCFLLTQSWILDLNTAKVGLTNTFKFEFDPFALYGSFRLFCIHQLNTFLPVSFVLFAVYWKRKPDKLPLLILLNASFSVVEVALIVAKSNGNVSHDFYWQNIPALLLLYILVFSEILISKRWLPGLVFGTMLLFQFGKFLNYANGLSYCQNFYFQWPQKSYNDPKNFKWERPENKYLPE